MVRKSPPETSTNFDIELHTFRPPPFISIINQAIEFFTHTPLHPLPPPDKFAGQGVYGLYYLGNHEAYKRMAEHNRAECNAPIYVGKAVRPGRRKGKTISKDETQDLFKRLREHTKSLAQADNLKVEDFRCRFIVLGETEGELIVPLETEVIRRSKSLWNMFVDGFGNHDPGKGRYAGRVTEWDVLHPGRAWVGKMTGEKPSLTNILDKVQKGLEQSPLF